MKKNLNQYRNTYSKGKLLETEVPENPYGLFDRWFAQAVKSKTVFEANCMTLATIGSDGFPRGRIVLLKEYDAREGFLFFTNYKSKKGQDIQFNPKVSLSFFWPNFERQIIIRGLAEKVSADKSENYFNSRPYSSRLSAIISPQSEEVPGRAFLENAHQYLKEKLKGKEPVRPLWWGGYVVKPVDIEFWQGRPDRLHDRLIYEKKTNETWHIRRLAP